jgi:hypothetical protein
VTENPNSALRQGGVGTVTPTKNLALTQMASAALKEQRCRIARGRHNCCNGGNRAAVGKPKHIENMAEMQSERFWRHRDNQKSDYENVFSDLVAMYLYLLELIMQLGLRAWIDKNITNRQFK